MDSSSHVPAGERRPQGRRGIATSYFVIAALGLIMFLVLGVGAVFRRVSDVRLRLSELAVSEARHWSAQAIGTMSPPDVQVRVRDAVRERIKEVEAMRVEVVERPDPGLAGMDQYVIRIYARTHPVDWLKAELSWTMQVEGVFTRANDYRPGDLLRRAKTSEAEEEFPSWR